MATITLTLSTKVDKKTSKQQVLMRFTNDKICYRAKTNVFVESCYWDASNESIDHSDVDNELKKCRQKRIPTPENDERKEELELLLQDLKDSGEKLDKMSNLVIKSFENADKEEVKNNKKWLTDLIHEFNFPKQKDEESPVLLLDALNEYINTRNFSISRIRHFKVVWRTLKRFELYTKDILLLDDVTDKTLVKIEKFIKNEHNLSNRNENYKEILEEVPESRRPQQRGKNAIKNIMRLLRTFFKWAIAQEYTNNDPFKKYKIGEYVYGTPYYITADERNKLYHANFSRHPRIAMQRDIFVFQCLIGCRVSDLWNMKKSNIVDGEIQYVPRKTKEGNPVTVNVPLHPIAQEILERYKDTEGDAILPFTSQQHYNKDIKTMFFGARLNRVVTVINPTTGDAEQKPLYEVASSHMARRCFIGNLYNKVKDPNLIGVMSGHVENSRAFVRYREINKKTKEETISLL